MSFASVVRSRPTARANSDTPPFLPRPPLPPQEIGKGKPGPGRGKETGDDITRLERGTSASYLVRRLKHPAPELAEAGLEEVERRVQVAAERTTGAVLPAGQGERNDLGKLPKLSQSARAAQSGVSPRTQRTLDALARRAPGRPRGARPPRQSVPVAAGREDGPR